MNRAINFVHTNLSEQVDLGTLANIACLSKFHFCRIFGDHLGETPLDFMWRIRTEQAARKIILAKDKPITSVALEFGFSSSQSFSQAFNRRYQISPRAFRAIDVQEFHNFEPSRAPNSVANRFGIEIPAVEPQDIPVRIERRPSFSLAYVRSVGSYGDLDGGISDAFRELQRWAEEKNVGHDKQEWIGVCPDSPTLTPADRCIYDAGMPVPETTREDETVSVRWIQGGTYAVLTVPTNMRVLSMWQWLVTVWLPASGYSYGQHSSYEYIRSGTRSSVQLCLPIGLD